MPSWVLEGQRQVHSATSSITNGGIAGVVVLPMPKGRGAKEGKRPGPLLPLVACTDGSASGNGVPANVLMGRLPEEVKCQGPLIPFSQHRWRRCKVDVSSSMLQGSFLEGRVMG